MKPTSEAGRDLIETLDRLALPEDVVLGRTNAEQMETWIKALRVLVRSGVGRIEGDIEAYLALADAVPDVKPAVMPTAEWRAHVAALDAARATLHETS